MKNRFGPWIVLILSMIGGSPLLADDDTRVIAKLSHYGAGNPLRMASYYLTFHGDMTDELPGLPSGNEKRFYAKIWDGLFLQVTTETGEDGTIGYMFSFSKDEEDQNALTPEEPANLPTLREVTASDFRTDDNFGPRPLQSGPGKTGDRGALRAFSYPGFKGEIRVLEFSIGNAQLGKKPYFKTLSCLVTFQETKLRAKP